MLITTRPLPVRAALMLEQDGIHPLLARLYAARGVRATAEIDTRLAALLPPESLTGAQAAAQLLANALAAQKKLLIVADYDCDGATACAVGLRCLRALGAHVDYFVPNRFETGYGLSPEVVALIAPRQPDVLITVDNGIASVEGVTAARQYGMEVLITDHHLPAAQLPAAQVIVNPNQPSCRFASKALAGVGVMFYVMLALRAELRRRGALAENAGPHLGALLDLVALGTVADVVPLDGNNRILVAQGLARIRQGKACAGIAALLRVAGREAAKVSAQDLGFMIGPRVNAAGRLSDMAVGIECLTTDDVAQALNLAQQLDATNRERREIEADMREVAELGLAEIEVAERASLTLFQPDWHQGVVGLIAGRIKERCHRPVFAFARGSAGEIKGSGRSIPGLNLRDALDLLAKQRPRLLLRFGGHAVAAGVSILETDLAEFAAAFEQIARALLTEDDLTQRLVTDGELESGYCNLEAARLLQNAVWGQAFPAPLFADVFQVESQRLLKDKHLKLTLNRAGQRFEAIRFNDATTAPDRIRAAYRLDINEWNGLARVQLVVEHFIAA